MEEGHENSHSLGLAAPCRRIETIHQTSKHFRDASAGTRKAAAKKGASKVIPEWEPWMDGCAECHICHQIVDDFEVCTRCGESACQRDTILNSDFMTTFEPVCVKCRSKI